MVQNTKQGCGDDDADQKGLGRSTAEEKLAEFITSWRARVGGAGILTNLAPLPMSRNNVADYLGLSDMRTSRDTRLESVARTKADVRQRPWIYKFTPWSDRRWRGMALR